MGGQWDVFKGRIKEAAGALIGNKKMREQGQADQAQGTARQAVQKATDSVRQAAQDTADTVRNSI